MRSVENYINEDKYFSGIELFMRMKFRLEYYNVTRSLGNFKKRPFLIENSGQDFQFSVRFFPLSPLTLTVRRLSER